MPECKHCAAKTQTYLCHNCQTELKHTLTALANGFPLNNGRQSIPYLQALHDEAYGNTCKGESARRSTDHTKPLPVNLGASALLENVKDMLHKWAQKILIQGGC
jgi:hypothetical protein